MTWQQLAEMQHLALTHMGCTCETNVPYKGCKVDQFVTRQCSRCKCIETYEAMQKEPQA